MAVKSQSQRCNPCWWICGSAAEGQTGRALFLKGLCIFTAKCLGRSCTLLIIILVTFPNQILRSDPGGRHFMVSLKETSSTSPAVLYCRQCWAITATGTHICPEGLRFPMELLSSAAWDAVAVGVTGQVLGWQLFLWMLFPSTFLHVSPSCQHRSCSGCCSCPPCAPITACEPSSPQPGQELQLRAGNLLLMEV